MSNKVSVARDLLGPRLKSGSVDPASAITEAAEALSALIAKDPDPAPNIDSAKRKYARICRIYYTVAAVSRRSALDASLRSEALKLLYPLRSAIEKQILSDLLSLDAEADIISEATVPSFFGFSAKQGVSVRYPLSTCVPTQNCGGRCYAHDGRDRELQLIFRGVLNYLLGLTYERANSKKRAMVFSALGRAMDFAIKKAQMDKHTSEAGGFLRETRIRFSHVGEMVATPNFTNALAAELRKRDPTLACVLYTRHPDAALIDPAVIRVNFTIEGIGDQRSAFSPPGARLVSSAWDGKVTPSAVVNFLEHHVEKHSNASSDARICPVTASAGGLSTCDSAKCDVCFRKITTRASRGTTI